VTTEVNHSDLTGADLHPPLGTSESASALAIADVNNSILVEDSSGYDVVRVNLVDDEIVVGSSDRPIALKVYDPDSGVAQSILAVRRPAGFDSSPSSGTCQGLYQFDGNLNDSSGNGRNLTAAGTGTHGFTRWRGKSGVILDGARWFSVASTGFTSTTDLTIEMMVRLAWKGSYGAIVMCQDATPSAPVSRAQYSFAGGYSSSSFNTSYYSHQTSAPAAITWQPAFLQSGSVHAITLTRDSAGTGLSLYVDGALHDSTTVASAPGGTAPNTLFIGGQPYSAGNYEWEGELFSVAIHTGIEMGAAEVLARHQNALGWRLS
jgi:hypothetical protein